MAPARTYDPLHAPTTGRQARAASRTNELDAPTCGIAAGYLQANLIVLPSQYANDFEILCARNTVPCPLLAKSAAPGDFQNFVSCVPDIPSVKIASGIDIRTDAPRYNVFNNGKLAKRGVTDIVDCWNDKDHVAFLIGCSYSFENALKEGGLMPAHVLHGRNVPMYRTNLPLCPAGVFQISTYVVSMRMYRASTVEKVRDITRPYVTTHGEPIAWGWNGMRSLGIDDVNDVQWGDAPVTPEGNAVVRSDEEGEQDGYVPVFWGCGVTPQEAVMKAEIPGTVMGHAPGHMVVLDLKEEDVLGMQ